MTDRELLERAARAAGHETYNLFSHGKWNPLVDDGDALRLAVKLGVKHLVTINIGRAATTVEFDSLAATGYEMNEGDPNAATRRAIVRAAASMDTSTEIQGEVK